MNPQNTRDQSGEVTGNIEASESPSQSSIPEPIRAARAAVTGLLVSAMFAVGSGEKASANVDPLPVSIASGEIIGSTFSSSSILGGLGIIQNGDGNYAVAGREALSTEDQAQLNAFIAQVERFTEDFTEALTSASPVTGVHPRDRDENPSMMRLAEVFHTLDSNQKISLITSYNGAGERETALREAFAHVLPAHLGARRGELEAEFGEKIHSMILEYLGEETRTLASGEVRTRSEEYQKILDENGVYLALLTYFAEEGVPLVEVMQEQDFFVVLDAFSQAYARGEYSGDDAEFFVEDVAGIIQILYEGDDIPEMYRTLIEPILTEQVAQSHPALGRIYESNIVRERVTSEAERVTSEAERARDRRLASQDTLRILGIDDPGS